MMKQEKRLELLTKLPISLTSRNYLNHSSQKEPKKLDLQKRRQNLKRNSPHGELRIQNLLQVHYQRNPTG
jgi:hypothetical protein